MNPPEQLEAARPGLAARLYGNGDLSVYAVLDGASVKGLLKKVYEHEPEYCCLYRGELAPDTATVAPYLVRLEPDSPFTEWVFGEGWGVHWGLFVVSPANLRALRNHFREFIRVELPDKRTVLFRYYDPRVLRPFLPACDAEELGKFFGPVQSFVVEGEDPESGFKYSLPGGELKCEPFRLPKPAKK